MAPLLVPARSGKLHTSTDAHVAFRFPNGTWTADSPLAGDGFFARTIRLNGKRCTIGLTVAGTGKRRHPSLTTTPHSDHVQRGIAGDVHWLSAFSELPPRPPLPYAQAYRPAPTWVAFHWAAFNVTAQVRGLGTAACRRSLRHVDIAAVARSARVAHGGARNM